MAISVNDIFALLLMITTHVLMINNKDCA